LEAGSGPSRSRRQSRLGSCRGFSSCSQIWHLTTRNGPLALSNFVLHLELKIYLFAERTSWMITRLKAMMPLKHFLSLNTDVENAWCSRWTRTGETACMLILHEILAAEIILSSQEIQEVPLPAVLDMKWSAWVQNLSHRTARLTRR
jgi:hypothetical protein